MLRDKWEMKIHEDHEIHMRLAGENFFYITVFRNNHRAALSRVNMLSHCNVVLQRNILIINDEDLQSLKDVANKHIDGIRKHQMARKDRRKS